MISILRICIISLIWASFMFSTIYIINYFKYRNKDDEFPKTKNDSNLMNIIIVSICLLVSIIIELIYINKMSLNENSDKPVRYVGQSTIICINGSNYALTEIDGYYHFLYISDRGLAESADVPIEKSAIYNCDINDEKYFVDIYEFDGNKYYIFYIPENSVYKIENTSSTEENILEDIIE